MAGEISISIGMARGQAALNSIAMTPEAMMEALDEFLQSLHEFVDATVAAVVRWYTCFQGYLKRAALDASAEEWAMFDATWGAKIATLRAQARSVEAFRFEVATAGQAAKIDMVWRYVRACASLVSALAESRQHGLIVPVKELMKVEGVARRIITGRSAETPWAEPPEPAPSTADDTFFASAPKCKAPAQPPSQPRPSRVGPRKERDRRAVEYVRCLIEKAVPNSAPGTPLSMSLSRKGARPVPATASKPATAPANLGRPGQVQQFHGGKPQANVVAKDRQVSSAGAPVDAKNHTADAVASRGVPSNYEGCAGDSMLYMPIEEDVEQRGWFDQIHSEEKEYSSHASEMQRSQHASERHRNMRAALSSEREQRLQHGSGKADGMRDAPCSAPAGDKYYEIYMAAIMSLRQPQVLREAGLGQPQGLRSTVACMKLRTLGRRQYQVLKEAELGQSQGVRKTMECMRLPTLDGQAQALKEAALGQALGFRESMDHMIHLIRNEIVLGRRLWRITISACMKLREMVVFQRLELRMMAARRIPICTMMTFARMRRVPHLRLMQLTLLIFLQLTRLQAQSC
jgi:hypothetical protein